MSEKQVNIKITANTKDFNSAIDKAKREIEGLAEALEKLSANKIGEKIEEQFSNLSKVIKELEDKINAIVGSFDKLDKAKLDKAEDGLDDTNKAAEKLNDTLDDTANNIENVADSAKEFNTAGKSISELGKVYEETQKTLEKLTKEYEEAANKQKELSEAYERSQDALKELTDKEKELVDAYEKANKAVEEQRKAIDTVIKPIEEYNNEIEELEQKLRDANDAIDEQEKELDDISKEYDDISKEVLQLSEAYDELTKELDDAIRVFTSMNDTDDGFDEARERVNRLAREATELGNTLVDLKNTQDNLANEKLFAEEQLDNIRRGKEAIEQLSEELRDQRRVAETSSDSYDDMVKELDRLEQEADDAEKALDDLRQSLEKVKLDDISNKGELDKATQAVNEYKEAIDEAQEVMFRCNVAAQEQADELNKQYGAYESLSKWVEKYISDESKAIALRAQVAESFQDVAHAMEGVYADSKKLNNMDKINKVLKESKEYLDDFNLVSLDNVNEELDRFNKRLENTIDKQKRYKAVAQEFGTDDGKEAYRIQKKAEALKEWADSADFAVGAADKLAKAWGNVSAAGAEDLKISERSKYLEEYGNALKENVKHIQEFYKELKTLDEIYEKCTDDERAIIDDYKYWEKNKEKLEDYNQAIRDYLSVIKESGGQISEKFLDDKGAFDIKKFIENYNKFGEANNVLKKSMEALKIKTMASVESLIKNADANKQAAKEAVKNTEAVRDQAKAQEKAAQSEEERLEAAKKLAKAEEELAEAKKKLKNFDQDLLDDMDKLIKKFNEGAEAARKLGINMKDITKIDIGKIAGGKPFASLLDGMDTFGNDLPKSLDDFKRQVKAIFEDMDGFDLGSVFDGLKALGGGILSALPTELKIAAGAAWGLYEALKACAEVGINQFSRGMETISGALSGIMGIARSVGTEIRDAFENITGMHLDASSLMEIPIDFESQMAKVGAIAGVTGTPEFDELVEEARRLGAETRYSATEVGQAMEYMGMAGWKNKEIMAGLASVLNLATVADMDLGQASDFVTDALTALGMEAGEAGDMVDMLAAVSTNTNTSVAQMQKAFTNVAPIAGSFNMTMKDLSMSLGLMANQGVKGAKAGTALKNLIANMNRPTEEQLAIMKKYNLLGARKAMVDGNLLDGIKQMKAALSGLSNEERNQVIEVIAGLEALSGVSALLNSTEKDIADLEVAMNNCGGAAQEMAEDFDDTLKGKLKILASAMQETLLQAFDKVKDGIKDLVIEFTEFFSILNGFSDFGGVKGLEGALAFLENASQGWGQAIADGLANAINSIDDFLNSASFDNLLQVGTNIIDGIADGIKRAADDGSLDSAISTAIGKIATWFSENLETIIDVGKEVIDAISKGISENGPAIGKAIRAVMDLQTEIDKAVAKEKWKLIGDNLVSFICEGITSKVSVFISALSGFFSTGVTEALGKLGDLFISTGSTLLFDPIMSLGKKIGEWLRDAILDHFDINLDGVFSSIGDKISGVLPWGKNKKKSSGSSKGSSSKGSSKAPTVDTSSSPIDIINSNLSSGKSKTDATAASIGEGISDNITSKLETMDAAGLKALGLEMQNLQKTVTALGNGMAASFKVIQDSARTAFMNFTNIVRNQMLNCTNIIRNQCINWYNIINNQVTNARNALTSQFLSMAAVARTQMVNISNIVRNQAVAWKNIISNQVKNARDALTRQFMSMAAVARTQMNKVTSAVRSSMSNIASATSRGISMNVNVNRNASGGYAMPSANALYAANAGATFSLGNNMSTFANNASYAAPSGNSGNSSSDSAGGGMVIEVPLYLDGKVVARATARYVDNELKQMTKRENRKRGAK